MARLGDVCDILSGFAFKSEQYVEEGIRIIRIANVQKGYIEDSTPVFYPIDSKDAKKYSLEEGDMLMSLTGNVGRVARLSKEFLPAALNQRVACLRIKDGVAIDKAFLFNLLNSDYFEQQCIAASKGVAQKNMSTEWLKEYEIPIFSMEQQKAIASVLDKVSDLITLRKEQLAKLDQLVKSLFIELFGDPVTNPKGWDMPLIEDVVANEKNALKAGPFGSALKKEYYVSSGYKIYGQEQVISGDHTFGDYYIDEERYKILENCAVQAGDVLISLVGTYGKLLVMPEGFEPGIINPRLMKITFDKSRVNPYYFQHYFQSDSLKKALAENTHGGTMDILNLGIVRKLAMPLPPLVLQNEFISFVEQTDKSKLAIQQSLDKLELLKKSLMQEYFG